MTDPTDEIREVVNGKNANGWSCKVEALALCDLVDNHWRAFESLRAMLRLGAFGEDSGSTLFSHDQIAEMTAVIDGELNPIDLPYFTPMPIGSSRRA